MLETIHEKHTFNRRIQVLSQHVAELIEPGSSILDVGCGDGQISELILNQVPDSKIEGIDVMSRSVSSIKVTEYDGLNFPFEDNSFDTIVFVDVLHHASDASRVLTEAGRVAKNTIIIKDHLTDGFLNEPFLKFMDYVGNKRHGVALPYDYWSESKWRSEFDRLSWQVDEWNTSLNIYSPLYSWLFDRNLHFVAKLKV